MHCIGVNTGATAGGSLSKPPENINGPHSRWSCLWVCEVVIWASFCCMWKSRYGIQSSDITKLTDCYLQESVWMRMIQMTLGQELWPVLKVGMCRRRLRKVKSADTQRKSLMRELSPSTVAVCATVCWSNLAKAFVDTDFAWNASKTSSSLSLDPTYFEIVNFQSLQFICCVSVFVVIHPHNHSNAHSV